MSRNSDAMVHRWRLRTELQRARDRAGLTQRQVAQELGWSQSKLLRVENGQVGVSRTDLKALLTCYQVTDPDQVARFIQLAERGRRSSWSAYADVLDPEFLVYLGYESSASRLRQFQQLVIPGLLQTGPYTEVLNKAMTPDAAANALQRQGEVRTVRQELLNRPDPPQLHFILDEPAVRRWFNARDHDGAIMREQLSRLKELAQLPFLTLQVIPFSRGPHRGFQGPFVLLDLADPADHPLLFRENGSDSVASRGDLRKINHFVEIFDELAGIATSAQHTIDFLDQVLEDLARVRR